MRYKRGFQRYWVQNNFEWVTSHLWLHLLPLVSLFVNFSVKPSPSYQDYLSEVLVEWTLPHLQYHLCYCKASISESSLACFFKTLAQGHKTRSAVFIFNFKHIVHINRLVFFDGICRTQGRSTVTTHSNN